MWTCPKCKRIFEKNDEVHSCNIVPLNKHFKNKIQAKKLFYALVAEVKKDIGTCRLLSLPCCVHLFGKYDFMAALPKKDSLEVRFALDRILDSPRLKQSVPLSSKYHKNCINITEEKEIDKELIAWINESYHLKDNHYEKCNKR